MSQHEVTTEGGDGGTRQAILDVLADPACRSMLQVISDRSLTAPEVAERTDIPLSTVYRKFDRLVDTPLVESTYRLWSEGKHPREYQCTFDRIQIRMADREHSSLNLQIS